MSSDRTISLPASLVEDLVKIQAGELQRLKKQLEEAQLGNTSITSELSALVESTARVIADLDQALTQSQNREKVGAAEASAPATPKSSSRSRSRQSTPSVFSFTSFSSNVSGSGSHASSFIDLEQDSTRSEAYTDVDANFSSIANSLDVGHLDDFSDSGSDSQSCRPGANLLQNQGSEMSLMESLATRPLKPFSYKPWPQQYIKTLRQLGILTQPSFYPGDELIFNFTDRRQVHLITVMYTTNNAQRTKKLHAWCEEFALKGWCGALMMKHEEAWYYAGTYRTTGYMSISGEEFEALPEKTKAPVYVQATHAVQVPKARTPTTAGGTKSQTRGSTSKFSTSAKKNTTSTSTTSTHGGKKLRPANSPPPATGKENKSGSGKDVIAQATSAVPSRKEVQAQIADGRIELVRITFSLVSWNEEIQKGLVELDL